jgi:hypothetical protein
VEFVRLVRRGAGKLLIYGIRGQAHSLDGSMRRPAQCDTFPPYLIYIAIYD